MKYLARTPILVIAIAFLGTSAAEDWPSLPGESRTGPRINNAKDWSQTHLFLDLALREQIERTQTYLDEHLTGMNKEISRLKTEGVLDRRSTSEIRNALNHARNSMTGATEGIEANEQIDGWTARMISYELGMAADMLAKQAGPIEAALNARPGGGDGASGALPSEEIERLNLADTLRESSSLLKQTAQAIVSHLK